MPEATERPADGENDDERDEKPNDGSASPRVDITAERLEPQ